MQLEVQHIEQVPVSSLKTCRQRAVFSGHLAIAYIGGIP